ncbi:MAG: thiol:disulfide interchange protein DsbG [Gammaproteobacteria bacterium]|nr:thiol:disulfide interchange protein DsbG [Gammaproteobacteria bacterium]
MRLWWALLPATVGAQPASLVPAPALSTLPPVLQAPARAGKVEVLRSFATGKPGLTGYLVRHDGQSEVVFGEDGYLIVGHLFSPQGEDLAARYRDRYLPRPEIAAAVEQLERSGHLIVEGPDTAPVLYVFADPNCIFCHRFYQMAEPLVKAGRLQLRWALVGFLQPTSAGRAAAILAARDPLQALRDNEVRFNVEREAGGIAPAQNPDPSTQTVIEAHFAAMQAVGGSGTPTLLYRTGPKTWAARVGLPQPAWLEAYVDGKSPDAGGAR